jgi:hypothetical protein
MQKRIADDRATPIPRFFLPLDQKEWPPTTMGIGGAMGSGARYRRAPLLYTTGGPLAAENVG